MDNKVKRNILLGALGIALAIIIGFSLGNILEESFSGSGDISTSYRFDEMSAESSAKNASKLDAKVSTTWNDDEYDKTRSIDSSFVVIGADPSGKYFNRYVVKSSGAGYKHQYRVYYDGDFSGSAAVTVALDKTTGAKTLDSLFLFDSRNGNATFQGRVYGTGKNGKPLTAAESDAYGKQLVRSYLNISDIPDAPEDFCNSLNRDIIKDDSSFDGIYTLPINTSEYNYIVDKDMVKRVINATIST